MRVAIIGAGSWGTALANVAARAGHAVELVARSRETADLIRARRENPRYLPGVHLAARVEVAADSKAASSAEIVLLAVPAQAVREVAARLAPELPAGVPVVACAKGIERATGKWMTEVLAECLPANPPAILSGPSFARDVAAELPTAVTLAAPVERLAKGLADALGTPSFRLYHSSDVRGVEIGGATKNVLAIAAGIVVGRGLGASAQAALIARGFAELARFGRAYGAREQTLTGLSGLGDLVLTCSSPQSRNFSLGLALGRGEAIAEALSRSKLAEGIYTAGILVSLAGQSGVEMPIAENVDAILSRRIDVAGAIGALLSRPQKAET